MGNGETMETVTNFIFFGSKITADGDGSHQIKRHLLFGRKVMTNLDSILKSRDITLPTKVHLVKAMVFQWSCMDVESEKVDLKLNIQKTKVMASGPITSWEIDGETVSDFIFLGSIITADGDCSHEIKRRLLVAQRLKRLPPMWETRV